ncbi:MAG: metallophosphoesterase family protein [Selenomonadaceae bacterium]|nr:metallophosphoesterase family protein [Selenomonadaceae bacterium]
MCYNYTRRHFLKICGRVMAALGLGSIYNPLSRAEAAIPPAEAHSPGEYRHKLSARHLRQIITGDSRFSRTIMWELDALPKFIGVEYRLEGDALARWQEAAYRYTDLNSEYNPNSSEAVYIFTSFLGGLSPGALYEYRVIAEGSATPWHKLATPPDTPAPFQAIIVCDSQCGYTYADWKNTIHQAAKRHPQAEFIADIGDIVDNGQSAWHWREWYGGIEDILPDTAFVPVMGNHECYDLKWQMCLPHGYLSQFSQPGNGSASFSGYYYSFLYGAAKFFVLNTQFEELDNLKPGLLAAQLEWLRQETQNSREPWKIVLMHKDILAYGQNSYTGGYGGIDIIGHDFMATFEELNIDLVLSAHLHTYRNRGHIFQGKRAAHGPYYVLCGLSGNAHYDVPDEELDLVKAPQPETDNYLTLDVSRDTLELRCYLPDGAMLDEAILRKPPKQER